MESRNPQAEIRAAALRKAIAVQGVTIAWMILEAAVALASGIAAGSLALLAFGADSVIELLSALVVYRRLAAETKHPALPAEAWQRRERRAAVVAGYLLYALAAYVLVQAAYGLSHRHQAQPSWPGLGITLAAALGMPWLARIKLRLARTIDSRALRADAMETLTCGYLSWVVLAGLAANRLLGWWWLDAATALVIVPLLVKEAREAIRGQCNCQDGH